MLGADQTVVVERGRAEDLREVGMNRGGIVDDQNPPVGPRQQ